MTSVRVEIGICSPKFLFSISSGASCIWYGHLVAAYLKTISFGVRLAVDLISCLCSFFLKTQTTVFVFSCPWYALHIYIFCSILQFLSRFPGRLIGSCQDAVRGERRDREVPKHSDRLHGSSSMTFYLEIHKMQGVACCIWYTQGTAVVSVAMHMCFERIWQAKSDLQ